MRWAGWETSEREQQPRGRASESATDKRAESEREGRRRGLGMWQAASAARNPGLGRCCSFGHLLPLLWSVLPPTWPP